MTSIPSWVPEPGETTDPRSLNALRLREKEGNLIEWNLLQRVKIGEELPPLGAQGKAGESLGTYLKRKEIWQLIDGST